MLQVQNTQRQPFAPKYISVVYTGQVSRHSKVNLCKVNSTRACRPDINAMAMSMQGIPKGRGSQQFRQL